MRSRTGYLLALILSISGWHCFAQSDTAYIKPYERNLSARIFFSDKFTSLTHTLSENDEISYHPNIPLHLGVGLAWRGVGASISFGAFKQEGEKTKARDLQCHFYGRSFVADLFAQDYQGFTVERNDSPSNEFRSDLRLLKLGGFVQYATNNRRFSYRAALEQNELQLRSAGSLLVGAAFYYTRIDANSKLTEEGTELEGHFMVGPNVGYAYSWIIKKSFFASLSVSGGANFTLDKKTKVYPTFFPRVSLGYNSEKWSIGVSGIFNTVVLYQAEDSHVGMSTGDLRLTYIHRFVMNSRFLDRATLHNRRQRD